MMSALTPISANFIAADSPAKPPPMIITLCSAMFSFSISRLATYFSILIGSVDVSSADSAGTLAS